jgi:hypothetical protein
MNTQDEILKYLAESPHTSSEIAVRFGYSHVFEYREIMEALRILELAKKVKYRSDKGLWYLNEENANVKS